MQVALFSKNSSRWLVADQAVMTVRELMLSSALCYGRACTCRWHYSARTRPAGW